MAIESISIKDEEDEKHRQVKYIKMTAIVGLSSLDINYEVSKKINQEATYGYDHWLQRLQ